VSWHITQEQKQKETAIQRHLNQLDHFYKSENGARKAENSNNRKKTLKKNRLTKPLMIDVHLPEPAEWIRSTDHEAKDEPVIQTFSALQGEPKSEC
jgi:hypothetical protein